MHPYLVHAERLLREQPTLVVYDLETTGLLDNLADPMPEPWELAALRVHPDGRRESGTRIMRLGRPIPADAARITRVDPLLPDREGLDPVEVLTGFARLVEGAVLVGQNIVRYDNPLLAHAYALHGLVAPRALLDPRRCLDTLILAEAIWPKGAPGSPARHRLVDLAEHLQLPILPDLHRAGVDVALTARVCGGLLARAGLAVPTGLGEPPAASETPT